MGMTTPLQRIANGRTIGRSGHPRPLRAHELVDLAREECERLGLPYDQSAVGIGPRKQTGEQPCQET